MQGQDFAPLYLQDKLLKPWRDEFFYEWPSPFGPPHGPASFLPQAEALVRKDFKYMYWPEHKFEQLFNLREDSMEENDVANTTEHAGLLLAMKTRFLELKAAVTKEVPVVATVVPV
jgi:arylsulfatase